jgi:hypothetical protein
LWLGVALLAPARVGAQQALPDRDLPLGLRSVLGLQLNRDGLAETEALFGRAAFYRTSSGHDDTVKWCYRSGDVVIEFGSEPEFGGENRELHEISLRRGPPNAVDRTRCPVAPVRRLATPAGLGLGSSRSEFERLLGAPTGLDSAGVVWEFSTTELLDAKEPNYGYWDARRDSCFGGKPPFVAVGVLVRIAFDARGAREVYLSRFDDAIC